MRENRTSGLTRGKGETNTTLPSLLYCFSVFFVILHLEWLLGVDLRPSALGVVEGLGSAALCDPASHCSAN